MAKYVALYKCPLCGELLTAGAPTELPYNKLPELLGQVVKQQMFLGTSLYKYPLHIPHKCANGSAGLAYFAGFANVD